MILFTLLYLVTGYDFSIDAMLGSVNLLLNQEHLTKSEALLTLHFQRI